jgi:hypothetical protein
VLLNTIGPLPSQSESVADEKERQQVEKRRAAITIVEAALRRHRIDDLDSVSARKRAQIIEEIRRALGALDVPEPKG